MGPAPKKNPLLLDGAMGSALASRGVRVDGPAWSARAVIEAPHEVRALHQAYRAAGATVHTANTFRATERALDAWAREGGPRVAARDVVLRAVDLARDGAGADARVAGSIGPAADCYHPEDTPPSFREEHARVATNLVEAGVDLILCETFANDVELVAAVEVSLQVGAKEVWASLTPGPSGDLLSPEELARAALRACAAGASCVLVNCVAATKLGAYVDALALAIDGACAIGAYANAGSPDEGLGYLVDWGEALRPDDPTLALRAERFANVCTTQGSKPLAVLGGCCGTFPAHIAALAHRLTADRGQSSRRKG